MIDQPRAAKLAREGFDLWQAGNLHEAVGRYREALDIADPNHYALGDYHGEFASVLEALGATAEAGEQLELAAEVQRRVDGNDSEIGVTLARYFLAEHLTRHGKPERALEVIAPSLAAQPRSEWLLQLVRAEALHVLGRAEDANLAAMRALELAPTDKKREELRARLHECGLKGGWSG